MVRRALFIPLVLLLLSFSIVSAGKVRVEVGSSHIVAGEGVRVKIVAEGSDVKFPPISEIDGYKVENLKKSSMSSMQFINGKFSSSTKKVLSFDIFPRKDIVIPSFTVEVDGKKQKTKPKKISLVKPSKASSSGGFYITMKSDKKSVYTGEPVILTVDVVEPINGAVAHIEYRPPEFNDFFVKSLGDEKRYPKKDGTVHELKYLLIPKKAGRLVIEPAECKIGLRDMSAPADPFGLFTNNLRWHTIRSSSVSIDAKPIPADIDAVGKFKIEGHVDSTKGKANKPVDYTLVVEGEGSLEDLEEPKFDIPGVTVYSDEAKIESKLVGKNLHSRYIKKYTFISDKSFTIPAVKLKTLDYKSGRSKSISTKAIKIKIEGSASTAAPSAAAGGGETKSTPPKSQSQTRKHPEAKKRVSENILSDDIYYAKKEYEKKSEMLKWYIVAAFFAGMALMYLLGRLWGRVKLPTRGGIGGRKRYSHEEAWNILYPHIDESEEAESMIRSLYAKRNGDGNVTIDEEKLDRLCAKYDNDSSS